MKGPGLPKTFSGRAGMDAGVDGGGRCRPSKDFLRHIANRVIAEYASKIAATTLEDLRKMLSNAEDKYKFTIYGGDPARLLDYFSSEDWADLVEFSRNTHTEEMLVAILRRLADEYESTCPEVASKAREEAERIQKSGDSKKAGAPEAESLDRIVRRLKLMGFKVDVKEDSTVVIDEGIIKVELRVREGSIRFVICREGIAKSLDGVLAKLERVREI